jgi:hypothetical protein
LSLVILPSWPASDLDPLARYHFYRYGRRAKVKVENTPSLFYTTQRPRGECRARSPMM